jgi:hypothetical protein
MGVRFARGANNPPFAMRLQRMGHSVSGPVSSLSVRSQFTAGGIRHLAPAGLDCDS